MEEIFYESAEVEEAASGLHGTFVRAAPLLGSNMKSISFTMLDGHEWVLERRLGLPAISFHCPTPDDPHFSYCRPGFPSEEDKRFVEDFFKAPPKSEGLWSYRKESDESE